MEMEQKKLINDVATFLKEEGFCPSMLTENIIDFKKEGEVYSVKIERDTAPFFATVFRLTKFGEGINTQKVTRIVDELDGIWCIKASWKDRIFAVKFEMILMEIDTFKDAFYTTLKMLDYAMNSFFDKYND